METTPAPTEGGESGRPGGGGSRDSERGREERFRAVYDTYGRFVLAYARRRTDSNADADEVFAEAMAICWRRLDDIPTGATLPWLYTVAGRVLSNHRRGRDRRLRLLDRVRSHEAVAARVHAAGGDLDRLDAALAQLRDDDRELLRLATWEHLTPAEIAQVLGITPNAAAVRLHRARQALKQAYEDVEEEVDR